MDWQDENEHIIVNCGQRIDLESVQDQRDLLIKVLALKKPIIFKANEVIKVDTAGLQLFLSFTITATSQNISWKWETPSSTLVQVSNLLGMKELLRLAG